MTIYIHNTGEPHAVPTQPILDIRDAPRFGWINQQTQGRCGFCASVPKIWLLEMPFIEGTFFPEVAGKHYLHKVPYDHLNGVCTWTSVFPERMADAAVPPSGFDLKLFFVQGPYSGQGFEWRVQAPLFAGGIWSHENPGTIWVFDGDQFNGFRCCRPNRFRLAELNGGPYPATSFTITPFHP